MLVKVLILDHPYYIVLYTYHIDMLVSTMFTCRGFHIYTYTVIVTKVEARSYRRASLLLGYTEVPSGGGSRVAKRLSRKLGFCGRMSNLREKALPLSGNDHLGKWDSRSRKQICCCLNVNSRSSSSYVV